MEFVTVDDSRSRTAEFVRDRIGLEAGEPLDTKQLESDIAGAFGRGTYDSISYRLAKDERGRQGVEVTRWTVRWDRLVFRAGLQINDDFEGTDDYQLNLETRLTGLNSKGAEWRTFLGIGRVASIATDLYLPFGERGNWFATPEIAYAALNQPLIVDGIDVAQYRVESWLGSLRLGRDFGDRLRLSAAVMRGEDRAVRQIGSPDAAREEPRRYRRRRRQPALGQSRQRALSTTRPARRDRLQRLSRIAGRAWQRRPVPHRHR